MDAHKLQHTVHVPTAPYVLNGPLNSFLAVDIMKRHVKKREKNIRFSYRCQYYAAHGINTIRPIRAS